MKTQITFDRTNAEAKAVSPLRIATAVHGGATAFLCVLVFCSFTALAETNNLTGALQRGLFEEEANRNLDAAAQAYQAVSAQFDKDRKLAATAIFRLGEVYRKQNKTNEAVAQYERIVREFSDQETLATLSRQNLAGMGFAPRSTVEAPVSGARTAYEYRVEAGDTLSRIVAGYRARGLEVTAEDVLRANPGLDATRLRVGQTLLIPAESVSSTSSMPTDAELYRSLEYQTIAELRQLLPTLVPDELLTKLLEQQQTISVSLTEAAVNFAPEHPNVLRLKAMMQNLDEQIQERIRGILAALKVRADLAAAAKADPKPLAKPTAVTTVVDAEETEIRRIQTMIQNSPDLINAPRENGYTPLGRAANADWLRVAKFLLDNGAAIQQGGNGSTPLHEAVRAGNRAMVELLVERGADLEALDGTGSTALHLAAENGYLSVAETLVQRKANLEARNSKANGEQTPLERAAAKGHSAIIALLAGKGAELRGALIQAAIGGHTETMRKLIELGAKPDVESPPGITALSHAAQRGNLAAVQILLAAKANPDAGSNKPPLILAAFGRHVEIAESLLRAGASPNREGPIANYVNPPGQAASGASAPGDYRLTPLQIAVARSDVAMVKLLLQNKADANSKSHEKSGWASPPAPLTRWTLGNGEMLRLFLEAGAEANAEAWQNTTLLSAAAPDGNVEVLELLLSHGAKPDVFDTDGETPLSRTAGTGCLPCVQVLLKFKANPDLKTSRSGFALLAAMSSDRKEVVGALVNGGANVNQALAGGWTPVHSAVHFALKNGDADVLKLLLEKGADPNVRTQDGTTPLGLAKTANPSISLISLDARRDLRETLAAMLRTHGALDDLPDFRSIGVSRASSGYRATVFSLGTNQWNRFKLSELIAKQLGLLSTQPAGNWTRQSDSRLNRWNQNSIRFPDFSRVAIHRPSPDGKRRTQIPVNFSPGGDTGGKQTDLDLQPGDVVEIPEADHPVSESWLGPTASELQSWTNALARTVTLVIAGQPTKLRLTSDVEIFTQSMPEKVIIAPASFMIRSVLDQSRLVRFSSDLTRVNVTRPTGAEGKRQSWVVDCSGTSPLPDLWLQDGDEIEVPDKP